MQAAFQLVCDPQCSEAPGPPTPGLVGCAQALDQALGAGGRAAASQVHQLFPGRGLGKLRAQSRGAAEPPGEGGGLRLPGGATWHLQLASRVLLGRRPRTGSADALG